MLGRSLVVTNHPLVFAYHLPINSINIMQEFGMEDADFISQNISFVVFRKDWCAA